MRKFTHNARLKSQKANLTLRCTMYIVQNVRQNCKNLTIYTRLKHSINKGRIADKQIENSIIQTL